MGYIKMNNGGRRRTISNFRAGAEMNLDEGIIGDATGTLVKNFRFESGALTDGYGLERVPLYNGHEVWSAWDFLRYDFDNNQYVNVPMICNAAGKVYYHYLGSWRLLPDVKFTSPPSAFVYRLYGEDSVIMSSDSDSMVVWTWGNNPEIVENSPLITSFTMHFERLYVTTGGEQNKVYFSDDLDPTNWNETLSEGGFVQLIDERGKMLKVVDFLGYVYIFRELGVSRLVGYGDQNDFYVSNMYVSGGRIYGGSVTQTGSNIMLLMSDGLYSFDGYDMTKRLKNIKFLPSPECNAVYSEGKYYLSAKIDGFKSIYGNDANNALIIYDLVSKSYSVSELPIRKLLTTSEGVLALCYDKSIGKVAEKPMHYETLMSKIWESSYSDFGTPDRKNLKEISVVTATDFHLTITADGLEHSYVVQSAGDQPSRLMVRLCGKRFKFKIACAATNANIKQFGYVFG